jgi:hypothetical protein
LVLPKKGESSSGSAGSPQKKPVVVHLFMSVLILDARKRCLDMDEADCAETG